MRILFLVVFFLTLNGGLLASNKGGKAKAIVSVLTQNDKQGTSRNLSFKVKASEGYKLTFDSAPWQLSIKLPEGVVVYEWDSSKRAFSKDSVGQNKSGNFVFKKVDPSLPGFTLSFETPKKISNYKSSYKLTAFTCTQSKEQCFREIVEGSVLIK